ncbi:B12-binding domain-containing radical SAM protein [Labilibacter marinus]|uniref:B12-binding domain-containing radical SAM protein n=1 Tax=Labilibacter marinus TaxID=1477105 RepID=UPI0009501F3E|nr:radical SAM protein [Labilibacter marinus]
MHYEGKIYRPWMEANSLLIQTTIGCSNNSCTFCDMFSDKKFGVRKLEDIYDDIEEAKQLYGANIEEFFLIDGNVMVMKTDFIVNVLRKIKEVFPNSKKISLYSQYNDFKRKTVDELKQIKQAGLTMAYVGLESGDAKILDDVKKMMTPEEAIEGAAKAKEAGIRVLVSIIWGLGGKERSKEHAIETTKLLNILQPEELAPMALAIQPGTELEAQVERGEFTLPTKQQVLEEEKYLLENLKFDTFYWGDHGNNEVSLKGQFPSNKVSFLNVVNGALENIKNKDEKIETFSW